MKDDTRKNITITLVLDEEEAKWLKATVQNYLVPGNPNDEDAKSREMRMRFWYVLEKLGV